MQHLTIQKLPDFNQASILVLGDVMLDRYWFGETARISPEAPVPIVKINDTNNRPGGAGNVALNIAALGAQVTLLGNVGEDEAGNTLKQQLQAAAVKPDLCVSSAFPTIIKLRVISRRQQLLRLDFEEKIQLADPSEQLARFKKHLTNSHLVILSDYQKGTLADPQPFIQLAKAARIPVIVDPKGQDFSIYRGTTILTPNLKEFQTVVGECRNEEEISQKARRLLADYQIETLLITRGADGMTLIQANHLMHFPAYARQVLDVTGAGDTVVSMLGAAFAAKVDLVNATALANLAASIAVGKLGAATVSTPELEVVMTGKTSFSTGIVNEEQLLLAVREAQAAQKKIVFTNGCFDILHAGHVTCLQMAKDLGDYLIVAVNDDHSIQKLKGPSRPINHLQHRMTVLAGLGMVDWVIPFADDTPERLLRLLQPDLLVKGGDYQLNQVVGADIVRAYGGEVRIVDSHITSSSNIITRIINRIQGAPLEQDQHG